MKISNSGPSEIGVQYNIDLSTKDAFQITGFPIVLIHFESPSRGQPLLDYKAELFILCPVCPILREVLQ